MDKKKLLKLIAVSAICASFGLFALSGCKKKNPAGGTGDGDKTEQGDGDKTEQGDGDKTQGESKVVGFKVTYTFTVDTAALTAKMTDTWIGEDPGITVDYSNATVPNKNANKSADDGFSGTDYLLLENGNNIEISVPEAVDVTVYTSHTNGTQNRTLYLTEGEHDAPSHSNKDIIVATKAVNGKADNGKLHPLTATVDEGSYYLSADAVGGMHVYAIILTSSDFVDNTGSEDDKTDGDKTDGDKTDGDKTDGDKTEQKPSGGSAGTKEPDVKIYDDEKNGVHPDPEKTSDSLWLSPSGNDSNDGSQGKPLYSLSAAVAKAEAGTTIFCMAGVYNYSQRVDLAKSGTADKPIIIQAYNWGKVEFNFSGQVPGWNATSAVGLYLTGNYWKLHGITVCYAGDNGIKIEGSYNYLGRCVTHHNLDTGVQLGFGHDKKNPGGAECSNNLLENCDSYLNCDHDANFGADADGFACKMYAGINNAFIGCRAWQNADDNWDLYEMDYSVLIEDCWAWDAGKKEYFTGADSWVKKRIEAFSSLDSKYKYRGDGSFNGNGNGIKLGGNSSNGVQLVKNCVSFGHNISGSVKGFDQNHNAGGIYLTNCVAWDNGYNFMLDDSSKFGHTILNSLSFYYPDPKTGKPSTRVAGELAGNGVVDNCNFSLNNGKLPHLTTVGTLSKDDFITLSADDAGAARQADGSLPNNGFARLKNTSPFFGKGMGLI